MDQKFLQQWLAKELRYVPHVYRNPKGVDTIGIGRVVHEGRGGISLEEANYLLKNDIATVSRQLDSELPFWREAPESVQHALVAMALQLGAAVLAEFRIPFEFVRQRRYPEARRELASTFWYQQSPAKAKRVVELFRPDDEAVL